MTQDIAREWFHYDPETGRLTWRKAGRKIRVGQEAGTLLKCKSGKTYRKVWLKGHGQPLAHRVIWVWMTGHWPEAKEQIDHEDGNGLHNWWKNLRLVSGQVEQQRNVRLRRTNTTGAVGVTFHKHEGKYQAYINVKGTRHWLGYFPRLEDAIAAREAASKKHGFHANHGQVRPL